MPGINGLQLYYKLREINKDFKVLFVSALEMPNELVNLLPGIRKIIYSKNLLKWISLFLPSKIVYLP